MQLASELIDEFGLSEPQVVFTIVAGNYVLIPLAEVLEFQKDNPAIIRSHAFAAKDGPLVRDHLRYSKPGDVLSFHILEKGTSARHPGRIQSRGYSLSPEGRDMVSGAVLNYQVLIVQPGEGSLLARHDEVRNPALQAALIRATAEASRRGPVELICDSR